MIKLKICELIKFCNETIEEMREGLNDDRLSDYDYAYDEGYSNALAYTVLKLYDLLDIKQYSIEKYLKLINLNDKINKNDITNYEDLSNALSEMTDGNLWAYSMEEMNYCLEENKKICIVNLENGNVALAELPE